MSEDRSIQMRYAGAIGLLCECSVALGNGSEKDDLREQIMRAATDWCEGSGWTVRQTLHRIEVSPP